MEEKEIPKKDKPNQQPYLDVCDSCKLMKYCILEMVGPTTYTTCLDCQKIPPAYRRR